VGIGGKYGIGPEMWGLTLKLKGCGKCVENQLQMPDAVKYWLKSKHFPSAKKCKIVRMRNIFFLPGLNTIITLR